MGYCELPEYIRIMTFRSMVRRFYDEIAVVQLWYESVQHGSGSITGQKNIRIGSSSPQSMEDEGKIVLCFCVQSSYSGITQECPHRFCNRQKFQCTACLLQICP